MCHHFKLVAMVDDLWIAFKSFMDSCPQTIPTGSFYPTNPLPVIRQSDDGKGELVPMEWGLLPSWWKPPAKSKSRKVFQRRCFNARCETIDEKPSYREAFKRRRCLVPASHFEEKGHYFSLPGNKLFAFAGLWESWQSEDESVLSCTILTTDPNAEVRSVGHPRMPIVLRNDDDYSLWMNSDIDSREPLAELMRPFEDGLLEIVPINGA